MNLFSWLFVIRERDFSKSSVIMDHGYCICYLNWFHIYGSRWIVTIKDNIFEHRFKKITDTFRCLRITNFKLHFFIVSDDIQEDLSDHYEIKYDCAEGVFQLLKYNLFKNKYERNRFIIARKKLQIIASGILHTFEKRQ